MLRMLKKVFSERNLLKKKTKKMNKINQMKTISLILTIKIIKMIIKLNCAAVLQRFKYHTDVKKNLLKLINNSYSDHMQNDYYGDDINRLDWSLNLNYNSIFYCILSIKIDFRRL